MGTTDPTDNDKNGKRRNKRTTRRRQPAQLLPEVAAEQAEFEAAERLDSLRRDMIEQERIVLRLHEFREVRMGLLREVHDMMSDNVQRRDAIDRASPSRNNNNANTNNNDDDEDEAALSAAYTSDFDEDEGEQQDEENTSTNAAAVLDDVLTSMQQHLDEVRDALRDLEAERQMSQQQQEREADEKQVEEQQRVVVVAPHHHADPVAAEQNDNEQQHQEEAKDEEPEVVAFGFGICAVQVRERRDGIADTIADAAAVSAAVVEGDAFADVAVDDDCVEVVES